MPLKIVPIILALYGAFTASAQSVTISGVEVVNRKPQTAIRIPDMTPINPETHGTRVPPDYALPKISFVEPAPNSVHHAAYGPNIRIKLDAPLHDEWAKEGEDSPFWMWLGFRLEDITTGRHTHLVDAFSVEMTSAIRRPISQSRKASPSGQFRVIAYLYNRATSRKWIAESKPFEIVNFDLSSQKIRVTEGNESRTCNALSGSPLYHIYRHERSSGDMPAFARLGEGIMRTDSAATNLTIQCAPKESKP